MLSRNLMAGGLAALLLTGVCRAEDVPPTKTFGWRDNWTGLYPDADPPAQWGRIPNGVLAGLTCQAAKPTGGAAGGQSLDRGLIRDWLVIGPFDVADSAKDLAKEQITNEPGLAPHEGDKVDELAWQRLQVPKKPDYELWGTTQLEWVDPGEALGFKPNAMAYACTYLYG